MAEFPHVMLREIYEQPDAIQRTLDLYVYNTELNADAFAPMKHWLNSRGEILITASGSSRHAGLAAEVIFEDLCCLAVDVEYASEWGARSSENPRNPSVLVISQSGETSDTLDALRLARKRGQQTLAIANVPGSAMLREVGAGMLLAAGPELAIPATKSFTCQLTAIYLLAMYIAQQTGVIPAEGIAHCLRNLAQLPAKIARQMDNWSIRARELAKSYVNASTFLYLGRGVHYAIAREGALKMKESSYMQAEGYPAGELKHGPNALVEGHVPLVVLATFDREIEDSIIRYEKTLLLLEDLKKQRARVIAVANSGDAHVKELASDTLYVQPVGEYLLPIIEVIPLQLFSYFMAQEHQVDVDHPRNLSKTVIEAAKGISKCGV